MSSQTVLPRWRGFNLESMVSAHHFQPLLESDFQWISELGFDFVRVPMSYRIWTDPAEPYIIDEQKIEAVDQAVRLGEKYGIHVDLNFHRGPGYCCMPEPAEPWSLWKSAEALRVFCFHWEYFARRYQGFPSSKLSFNLLNEAPPPTESLPEPQNLPMQDATRAEHEKVIRASVAAIRAIDHNRMIIVDGMWYGRGAPSPELVDLGVAQSTRAYMPMGLSHYKASWWREGNMNFPVPVWPGAMEADYTPWTRQTLEDHYQQWADLAARGVGVHCGEGGCYIQCPHDVFLKWFEDVLDILTGHNIGYALWNFRGQFGIVDSGRTDVNYEDFHGHKLDGKLLRLLQKY